MERNGMEWNVIDAEEEEEEVPDNAPAESSWSWA